MILDIGCGHTPKGDVNIDLYIEPTIHRILTHGAKDHSLDKKAIPNLIRADAQHLPLRDSTFKYVYSSHTIEHTAKPLLMLKEMYRVSSEEIHLRCPHRFNRAFRKPEAVLGHQQTLNIKWFQEALDRLGIRRWVIQLEYRYLPHSYFCVFRIPKEIQLRAWKN